MRFVYLGPPDEPDVWETYAFGQVWVKGEPAIAADPATVERLSRHPHWEAVEDEAHGFEIPPEGGEGEPLKRRPGRPRKAVD